MRFFSCLISFVSRCIAAACIESVGLYIANVLTFKRITTVENFIPKFISWTLYCKCTNFQANHNTVDDVQYTEDVGLYIANVLTFKRITTLGITTSVYSGWTLYCKCTNFQANHNSRCDQRLSAAVGLYIANVLTFKRITTG